LLTALPAVAASAMRSGMPAAWARLGMAAWAAGERDDLGEARAAEPRTAQAGWQAVRAAALRVGDPAPEAVLETLDGDHIRVSQLRGKVVVLDFWATWCGPCVAALPNLRRLAQDHAGQPFVLLSVSGDGNGRKLREFLSTHELGWTQCWDGNGDVQRRFGVRGFPTTFLIDRAGRIRLVKTGWSRRAESDLGREVDKTLAEPDEAPKVGEPAASSRRPCPTSGAASAAAAATTGAAAVGALHAAARR
jgi:peroxiredoxin